MGFHVEVVTEVDTCSMPAFQAEARVEAERMFETCRGVTDPGGLAGGKRACERRASVGVVAPDTSYARAPVRPPWGDRRAGTGRQTDQLAPRVVIRSLRQEEKLGQVVTHPSIRAVSRVVNADKYRTCEGLGARGRTTAKRLPD